ncbi:MAG: ATP-binding protein [Paludibacteraceae bacterium]|nr:ATP-binding protein [Paludibacteraceae bacterium]
MRKAKFEIYPHVIRQLGSELVSDSVTAIMELIKNSYDADADYVKVTINTDETLNDQTLFYPGQSGFILIEDNGVGMNEKTILDSWLVISFSQKRAVNGVKPKTGKNRTPLGDKGLGRLSTQRLAKVYEIYSKTKEDDYIHAGFEWESFDKVSKLSDVDVLMDNEPFGLRRGTKLVLTGLVDKVSWSGDNLERFKAQISQLISPYQENKPFRVYLSVNGESIDVEGDYKRLDEVCVSDITFNYSSMKASIEMDVRLLKLRGNAQNTERYNTYIVPDNGEAFLNYLLNKKKSSLFRRGGNGIFLHFSDNIDATLIDNKGIFEIGFSDPGPFTGRIREFALNSENDAWSNIYKSFDIYKSFVQNQIGIKLYRNGFAVKPYGIDGQDWLGLAKGQTSGASFYGLRPGNVIGYVAIDEDLNKNLKDKTDREGLIDNDYYRSFYRVNLEIIRRINEAMQIIRRTYNEYIDKCQQQGAVKTYNQAVKRIEDTARKGSSLMTDFKNANNEIATLRKKVDAINKDNGGLFEADLQAKEETLQQTSTVLTRYSDLLQQALEVLESAPELKESIEIIIPMVEQMRSKLDEVLSLASLGLVSEMVSHDMGQITTRLLDKSKKLSKRISGNNPVEKQDVLLLIEHIRTAVSSIRSQLKHLDTSFKYNKEKKDVISLSELLIVDEKKFYQEKIDLMGFNFWVDIQAEFSIFVNKGKMIQVFDNLINNSLYWLKKCYDSEGKSGLVMKATIKSPYVYFEDNGWGVDKSVEDSIFEPFVTRKPVGEGRGLGLYIIKSLLNADNCDIVLDGERNRLGNRYRFILNLSSITQ